MKPQTQPLPVIRFPHAFTYSRFLFRIKMTGTAVVSPFKGSMLRGLLGTALKQLYCGAGGDCQPCRSSAQCPYANLFKPELVKGKKWTTPPFVIYSPTVKDILEKGDIMEFTVTLFGPYAQYFEFFLNAFNAAACLGIGKRRTPYEMEEIRDDVSGETIYKDRHINRDWRVAAARLSDFQPEPAWRIRLQFLTPVYLKKEKKQTVFPDVHQILNGLIRRVHIISRSIWNDQEFTIFKEFIPYFFFGIDRYDLQYQKEFKTGGLGGRVELSGFTGTLECHGNFKPLMPLFRAGEVLHVGARSSYGLGKIEVFVL